ncbi:MAG: hypothetical protein OXI90_13635 [Gammaproteobacteria bacterium]|nr:hypothetical protein [Gammaproteobacteria bacterium]
MLLSVLGTIDRQIAATAKEQSGGLRAYIENCLGDELRLVQHTERPAVIAAVPRNEETDSISDWDRLLDEMVARPTDRRPVNWRYHRSFWAAFRQPLDKAKVRYVAINGPIRFSDELPESQPADTLEVPSELIVGLEAPVQDVHQNINAWLENNGLGHEQFLDKSDTLLPSNDVLGKLILTLNAEELSQISIPMHIVAKLRRQPV